MSSYASTLDDFDPLLGATPPNAPDYLDEEDAEDEAAGDKSEREVAADDDSRDSASGDSSRSVAAVQVPSAVSEGLNASIQHALEAELPDDSAAPGEIITACEQRINAAQVLSDAMEKRARDAYFHYAGPAVRQANRTEAWRHIEDPTTKKPYRSWSAWQRGNGISRQQAYRMVNEQPLVEALGLSYGDLGVRQVDVLTPVLKNHPARLAELWRTAEEAGDTSAVSLLKIRDALGLSPTTADGQDGDDETSGSKVPVLKFQAAPGAFDPARVDEATKASPEVARLIADRIYATLQAMEA
ncbi:hypothetical protein [Streptomyces virginiae]|uniref:hypothetical protein n=1 Tax=Streptomyces virginiae TaxID=1961 RepID=UPI002259F7E7|nr:hypothetical protein [Streptomyces virginiae]MCX5278098.1 hypothetical protein [Streptomyces virginiae]